MLNPNEKDCHMQNLWLGQWENDNFNGKKISFFPFKAISVYTCCGQRDRDHFSGTYPIPWTGLNVSKDMQFLATEVSVLCSSCDFLSTDVQKNCFSLIDLRKIQRRKMSQKYLLH